MLDQILIPLDGSATLAAAVPAVRQLVGGSGALVHLLAVRPPVRCPAPTTDWVLYLDELLVPGMALPPARRPPGPCLDDLVARERAIWLEYLRREGSPLAYDGVVVQCAVRFGDPLGETLAAAREHAVRLIVVGTEPQGPLARALRPGLAQRLLAQSTVPVLTVPTVHPRWPAVALRQQRAPT